MIPEPARRGAPVKVRTMRQASRLRTSISLLEEQPRDCSGASSSRPRKKDRVKQPMTFQAMQSMNTPTSNLRIVSSGIRTVISRLARGLSGITRLRFLTCP